MKKNMSRIGKPQRENRTCEKCKEIKEVWDIGVIGINSYLICESCFRGMKKKELKKLLDWLVETA